MDAFCRRFGGRRAPWYANAELVPNFEHMALSGAEPDEYMGADPAYQIAIARSYNDMPGPSDGERHFEHRERLDMHANDDEWQDLPSFEGLGLEDRPAKASHS